MSCGKVTISVNDQGAVHAMMVGGMASITMRECDAGSVIMRDACEAGSVTLRHADMGSVNISLVCKVGKDKFLRVMPSEPMWVTTDSSVTYTIYSNTNWIIV